MAERRRKTARIREDGKVTGGFQRVGRCRARVINIYYISRPSINNTEYTHYERVAVNRDGGKGS